MTDRASSPADLIALLERFRLPMAAGHLPADAGQASLDLLLARIAALTDALRGSEWNDTSRLAARMLLGDLAAVTAQFRANANAVSASLDQALEGIRASLEGTPPRD